MTASDASLYRGLGSLVLQGAKWKVLSMILSAEGFAMQDCNAALAEQNGEPEACLVCLESVGEAIV